jgi:predicted NAD/FAD-binding protein
MNEIVVIGSGIAGLTAAWGLSRAGWTVRLLDRRSEAGMDALAVDAGADRASPRVDVPVRMFQRTLWPQLCELYSTLEVPISRVENSQSFSDSAGRTWLRVPGNWRPQRFTLFPLLAKRRRLVARDARRLSRDAVRFRGRDGGDPMTLADWLSTGGYSHDFVRGFLYPVLSSTICTCSWAALDQYPAALIYEMLRGLTGQPLFRSRDGTAAVVKRLLAPVDSIINRCDVTRVVPVDGGVEVARAGGPPLAARHAIIAVQANNARQLLSQEIRNQYALLERFRYEDVHAVVHRDSELMPANRSGWRTFNFRVRSDGNGACCSVWLNRFYPDWPSQTEALFQTIWAGSPDDFAIDSAKVLAWRNLQRPVVDNESVRAVDELRQARLTGSPRIWFCGSYAAPGVPLLESGVVSALEVVRHIGEPPNR